MKHGNSVNPHIGEKSSVKTLPYPKTTGATSGKTLPPCTAGLGKTVKYTGKGNRHK